MTGPGQPRTCSHPINTRMLTGVCLPGGQDVFSLSISSVCRVAQEAGASHHEYIYRKKENVIFTPM